MPVRLIEPSDVRSFCFKPRFSNATKQTYLRSCRMFCKWMVGEGYADESVAAAVEYPRKKDKILGHSSLDVTKVYEHLNPTDLQNRMRELGL